MKQRLLAEEKKRKTLENELVMRKKDVPEKEDDFEVSLCIFK